MRIFISIEVDDDDAFRRHLLAEAMHHPWAMVLETLSEQGSAALMARACVAAFGCMGQARAHLHDARRLLKQTGDWLTGYIAYDYKNNLESLHSNGSDGVGFDELCFVQPRYLVMNDACGWRLGYHPDVDNESSALMWLSTLKSRAGGHDASAPVRLQQRVSRSAYIEGVNRIKQHIARGDVYEMNFCTEFFAENVALNAVDVYERLTEKSPMPFSAFVKQDERLVMCASPERYLQKHGQELISQPIKGTCRRGAYEEEDKALVRELISNEKERAENIMITDLVRNDLSRVALPGSVHVKELCGVYAFRQVHQMISTIGATLASGKDWVDAIEATFPMGSMTGAPKLRAMQLIEDHEVTRRGLYSGALGYVTPEGDFDLNVVIRSIQYNRSTGYASYITGSAITHLCDAHQEYDECLLKGKAMREVLEGI